MRRVALTTLFIAFTILSCFAAESPLERQEGFLPVLWNAEAGKVYLEIAQFDKDVLYYTSIAKGSGSGNVGFEWAGGGNGGVIQFERIGPKVLVVQKNTSFRAGNGDAALAQTVEESSPESILASLPIVKTDGAKVVVDASPLLIRDAVGFTQSANRRPATPAGFAGEELAAAKWKLDKERCAIYLPRTKAFPKNTEVEVTVTYEAESGGARTAPDQQVLTGRLHHSFVQAPTGYAPRRGDIRVGVNTIRFSDYSRPFTESNKVEWIRRHRLQKKDPGAAMSEPVEKIVYYLDSSVPEPVRSAMHDGFLWWNKSFEAAGFKNALEIRDLPPGMDPMDVRYNQIYWVDRDQRGYSTGGGLTDPRTGEILAARVRLESDRIRTIANFWRAFMPAPDADSAGWFPSIVPLLPQAAYANPKTQAQLVLLRQALLTAHEVGHSLGFAHNWNSSMNDRASVMEYPSPRLKLVNGKIDLTDAYQKQIGAYDTIMVRYAYTPFPINEEHNGLERIVQDMRSQGLLYTPTTDPRWNRYDDLADPAEYLRETMAQRKVLMAQYGPAILKDGEPYAELRGMRLWMVYLHHRWAIDAGVRYIGGMYHNFAVKGDSVPATEIVPAAKQREILALLIEAVAPKNLAIPEATLAALTVDPEDEERAPAQGPDQDKMASTAGYAFDHLSAAGTLANEVIGQLLEPEKAARMIGFADRQREALGLPEMLNLLTKSLWEGEPGEAMERSLRRETQRVFADSLMMLAANPKSTPEVKAVTMSAISALKTTLKSRVAELKDKDALTEAHLRQMDRDLTRFLENPATAPKSAALPPPIMAPI